MLKIHGDIFSGNSYKIKLLLNLLDIPHHWQHINILNGETHTEEFLNKNPNGKIPIIEIEDGTILSESNAIIHYLAEGTSYLPTEKFQHAKVLQWQFFEQYSHEPYIAVARYIAKYLGLPESRAAEYQAKQSGGNKALNVMEQQLKHTAYLTGDQYTIADISLYAYTHVAHEGGFDLAAYPNIKRWLTLIQSHPRHITMEAAAATL